uniref:ethanolamine kinase n=1 Tax=Strigamia maritima TaxID=126957 RepID=T1JNR7_STRMM
MAPNLHLDVTINTTSPLEDLIPIIPLLRPDWKDEDVKFETLPRDVKAGLLNIMIICSCTADMENAVMFRIRRNEEISLDHFLNRDFEVKNIRLAHELYGFAPNVLATFKNGFCYDYIHGEVMTPESVRQETNWRTIAKQLAILHSTELQTEQKQQKCKFTQFSETLSDKYPDKLENPKENERNLPSKAEIIEEVKLVIDHVNALNCEIVLCHNDSRSENMVWNKETGEIAFVDWEASSLNPQAYEIAYHFRNYAGFEENDFSRYPDKEYQMQWLRVYLETFYHARTPTRIVSYNDLNRLYVQVNCMYLVFLIQSVAWVGTINDFQGMNFDIMEYGLNMHKKL